MKKLFLSGRLLICILLPGVLLVAERAMSETRKDGDLTLPGEYKTWKKFSSNIQRPDIKQVREIFVNPTGTAVIQGKSFPNGTIFVMENYSAKSGVDGKPETGADGKLIKGDLAKVFVMEKGEGWGKGAPKELANGDWIYTAFSPDGKVLNEDYQKCRTCHIPLAQNDFIHRYDEYFNHK